MKVLVVAAWRFVAGLLRPSRRRNRQRLHTRGEDPRSLAIRDATAADIAALAALHVETWDATYAPLLMKGPSAAVRERQWREKFARNEPGWCCLVVENSDGSLVGFAQANRSNHPVFGGELNKIYLRRDYQGVGIGRRLVSRVARHFRAEGINSMWLCADGRNPSSKVWRSLGGHKIDPDPGSGNYGWRDLSGLASFPD